MKHQFYYIDQYGTKQTAHRKITTNQSYIDLEINLAFNLISQCEQIIITTNNEWGTRDYYMY